jgi:hypothetical protein
MKRFCRNETLHQTDSVCDVQKRKVMSRNQLAQGMAYATH